MFAQVPGVEAALLLTVLPFSLVCAFLVEFESSNFTRLPSKCLRFRVLVFAVGRLPQSLTLRHHHTADAAMLTVYY